MDIIKCPRCFTPVSGRECSDCGTNPTTADTVRCADCGRDVVTEVATEVRRQSAFSGGWAHDYYCPDCD